LKPDVQYNTEHPVYPVLQQIGKEITQKVKPKAVVVFSAHWMGEKDTIHINNEVDTDLIYEYVVPQITWASVNIRSVSMASLSTSMRPSTQAKEVLSLQARSW
jgi:aromatic ring-opening dioxygenase catalytic subunit (LigB family)